MNAKELAILFHETYERLAPQFGYETRQETRQFNENTNNGRLMIAVCEEILNRLFPVTVIPPPTSYGTISRLCPNCHTIHPLNEFCPSGR